VAGIRAQMTRRGKMLFVQLDDGNATVEVSVFNELFEAERGKIITDAVLVVEGKVSHDEFSGGNRIVADKLLTLGEARSHFARNLTLKMNGQTDVARLKALLAPFPGATAVRVRYRNHAAACELVLGPDYRVSLEDGLMQELRNWLKPENVEIVYA
jgi:DNA polymerase-3 subunit alpha